MNTVYSSRTNAQKPLRPLTRPAHAAVLFLVPVRSAWPWVRRQANDLLSGRTHGSRGKAVISVQVFPVPPFGQRTRGFCFPLDNPRAHAGYRVTRLCLLARLSLVIKLL